MDVFRIIVQLAFGAVRQLIQDEHETDGGKVEFEAVNTTIIGFVKLFEHQPTWREIDMMRKSVKEAIVSFTTSTDEE